jgi:hypothetical protein
MVVGRSLLDPTSAPWLEHDKKNYALLRRAGFSRHRRTVT